MAFGPGTQPIGAAQSLAMGSGVYARDILQNSRRQTAVAGSQSAGDIRALVGQGANPFAAQRQAGAQRFRTEAANAVATNQALDQRFNTLNQQAETERLAQEARGRQMLGSALQTAGSVASLIPGMGTAVGGASQAVGGMLGGGGGGGGGIGGAVQGLMGAFGGGQPQQASPMPTGAAAQSQAMAPPRTQAEFEFQQALPGLQQQQAQSQRATLEEQLRQRRESLFATQGQGGAWWRNGQ